LIDTQALAAGATVTFSGTYSQDPGPSGGFLQIPAGSFTMGSPPDEPGHNSDEYRHTVTLTTPFLMSSTEVTNQQYADLAQWAFDNGYCTATSSSLLDALDGSILELMGLDDFNCKISFSGGTFTADAGMEDHPVQNVTWYGAVAYCDWLSLQTGLSRAYDHNTWQCNGNDPYHAQGYRLPTEAEWEYACRAGSETAFANGEIVDTVCNDPVLDEIGWYCGNSNDFTHPVGQLIANDFGLYDMHGNLWDWCNDWYVPYDGDETDPVGGVSPPARQRVVRGGMWGTSAANCRSANRAGYIPEFSTDGYNINRLSVRPVRSTN
jgi:formylglycine-generating enzyme required for sulfatase activity